MLCTLNITGVSFPGMCNGSQAISFCEDSVVSLVQQCLTGKPARLD